MKNNTYKRCLIPFYLWIKTMWRHECMVGRSREQKEEVLWPLPGPHINRLACRHMGQQGRASRKPTEPQLPSGRRRGGKRQGEKRYSSRTSVVWHKETKRRPSKSCLGSPKDPTNDGEFSVKESLPACCSASAHFCRTRTVRASSIQAGQKTVWVQHFNRFKETWDPEISTAGWVALVPSFMGQGQQ